MIQRIGFEMKLVLLKVNTPKAFFSGIPITKNLALSETATSVMLRPMYTSLSCSPPKSIGSTEERDSEYT